MGRFDELLARAESLTDEVTAATVSYPVVRDFAGRARDAIRDLEARAEKAEAERDELVLKLRRAADADDPRMMRAETMPTTEREVAFEEVVQERDRLLAELERVTKERDEWHDRICGVAGPDADGDDTEIGCVETYIKNLRARIAELEGSNDAS